MNTQEIINKIQKEIANEKREVQNADGLIRLQEVMQNYNGEYKLIWSDDLLRQIQERPVVESHKIGLPLVDELTGGFREQQVITLSAHSKHGKTTMGVFLMEKLAHLSPVMIPLEQSAEELVIQRFNNKYSIPRFLSPEHLAARVTTDWIEERVIEGIAKYGTKMVVIDHLGYIDDKGKDGKNGKENLAYRIQVLMQELKSIAKKWNIILVLLCHISQQDEGKPPTLQDIKGSSGILQESDKVILLWVKNTMKSKVRVYSTKVLLSVSANRQTGKKGNVGLNFNTTTGGYEEDNAWVDSMMRQAESSAETDDLFGEL